MLILNLNSLSVTNNRQSDTDLQVKLTTIGPELTLTTPPEGLFPLVLTVHACPCG
jgi:hypothetical protein